MDENTARDVMESGLEANILKKIPKCFGNVRRSSGTHEAASNYPPDQYKSRPLPVLLSVDVNSKKYNLSLATKPEAMADGLGLGVAYSA